VLAAILSFIAGLVPAIQEHLWSAFPKASVGKAGAHSAVLQGIIPCVQDYRRNRVPGGSFFFTVNLLDCRSDLLVT
jgi:hypothetical protein